MSLFSFQGKIHLAERSAQGKPLKVTWLGNAPACTLQLATETTPKTESFSGNRLQYGLLQRGKTATLNLTLDEWTLYNLALALYAADVAIATGTVTGEALPSPLAAGDIIRLNKPFVSDVELTAAPSTALVEGTDFSVESASAGLIELLTPQTPAVTAAYENADARALTMFTTTPPDRWLILDGINTDNQEKVVVELFRCKFNPVGDFGLIHEECGNLPLTGTVLYDPLNASDPTLGGYGRIVQAAA